MASVAGRKKSIVSSTGLQIDTPNSTNNMLNKTTSVSLYQQCSSLRSRLMRIRGFPHYFVLASSADSRQSTDPVTQLWDLFSLGIPLCYIFDQLPAEAGFKKINHSTFNQELFDAKPDHVKKRAIALFAMQINAEITQVIPGCETFTVTDLWNRNSTDGLVKVIHTVTAIVNYLPQDAFEDSPPSPPLLSAHESSDSLVELPPMPAANAQDSLRNNRVREIVETERKFVQDLETMQKYSTAITQGNLIDQDTIHLLFPNLNKLLNFQRKFLIRLESTAELPWEEQRWGQHFLESEDEFIVYEPYCANYKNASELMLANEQNLLPLNHLLKVKGELTALLITPIQRVCKYPLLLDSLLKATSPSEYPYFDELKRGSEAATRILVRINEAQRRAENEQTVKSLHSRIDDWKGHHLENFGELLLDDIFVVTKSDIDREYHVFLFEKIILCCKEAPSSQALNGRNKVGKSNSILKKQPAPPPLTLPGGVGPPAKKDTPLLLKGRIFLGNVTQAAPVPARYSTASNSPPQFPLSVWWKGDDDLEFFTLRCRREDQMRQWEAQINRLIRETAHRRASERTNTGMARIIATNNSTNPSMRTTSVSHNFNSPISMYSTTTRSGRSNSTHPYGAEEQSGSPSTTSYYSNGPQGYPPHNGFEFEPDEDDYEDYPPASNSSNYHSSGRGTPLGTRRSNNALSLQPERDSMAGYERPRAQTEGTDGPVIAQWRQGLPPPVPVSTALPNSTRPLTPRLHSNASYQSDASFGNVPPRSANRPPLRSQFSSTKLKSSDSSDYRSARSATPTLVSGQPQQPPPLNRSRSASQPSAYVPKSVPPPLPVTTRSQWSRNNVPTNKRGSGSSQSTGEESSDYSPNSSSPITPFGSSESSLGGVGIRNSRQTYENGPPVKVKVHFNEDIFVIQVARTTEYDDLVEKVGRKIRLCGPRRDDGPLRVKYKDEDGDMVSLGSTEDVQMAFEQYRPGGQVILYVT